MITVGTRVAHCTTGLTGTVTQEAECFLHQPGPWVHVNWDDGLRCWVLKTSTRPEDAPRGVDGDHLYTQRVVG